MAMHSSPQLINSLPHSWFVVTVGTGGVSTLLYQIPYTSQWLRILSTIAFVLNIVLWLTFLAMSCLRYALYPEIWAALLRNPTQRLFLGAIPTGLGTIINMIVPLCVPAWGQGMAILAWVLWWINSVVAVSLCFYLTMVWFVILLFFSFSDHQQ
jgi:tellurite resistance protein TehA-like permease